MGNMSSLKQEIKEITSIFELSPENKTLYNRLIDLPKTINSILSDIDNEDLTFAEKRILRTIEPFLENIV